MKATERVLKDMREAADRMSPKSGIRSALEKWLPRLAEAVQSDVRATESPVAPVSSSPRYDETVHGVFDNQEAQERQSWALGRLQNRQARAEVERRSRRPWGSYPDLEGGA